VSEGEINTSQGLLKSDFFLNEEVSALPLEDLVGDFLHDDNYVTSLGSRELISLTMEGVVVTMRRSLINLSFENLLLLANLLSIASLALVLLINDFAFASALIAGSLRLCVHARA